MNVKPPPLTPRALTISEALASSAPLLRLQSALKDSAERFDAVQGGIPAALRRHVKGGPVSEGAWVLLAANPAVAAKLRHLAPRLEPMLAERGWLPSNIVVKVEAMP